MNIKKRITYDTDSSHEGIRLLENYPTILQMYEIPSLMWVGEKATDRILKIIEIWKSKGK